ncbi:MAG: M48 family metalloprotease [Deltaproteobacteria bacterium]|nr:M48 family metalloprotease [Deltaproteobacteria bacterium]
MNRGTLGLGLVWAALFLVSGCAEMVQVGTAIGQNKGMISRDDKQRIDRLAGEAAGALRPITAREEHFIGRAVAARLLIQYPLEANGRNRYLNQVGSVVALASDRPVTYGGYHFAVLQTDEVNALACPDGIILLTRGLLKRVKNEDELAAVLAHEVAHVNHQDGVASIQRARWTQVVTTLGTEAARRVTGAQLNKLVGLFAGSVDDVVKTLVVNGYGRQQELAADQSALQFLRRAGYSPQALGDFLTRLAAEQGGGRAGLLATHPGMSERLAKIQETLASGDWPKVDSRPRDRRFQAAMGAVG